MIMKYSKYFSLVNQHHGLQRLSTLELGRLFNIVHIEGRIKECDALIKQGKAGEGLLKYSKMQRLRTLRSLTGDKLPKDLIKEMHMLSQD